MKTNNKPLSRNPKSSVSSGTSSNELAQELTPASNSSLLSKAKLYWLQADWIGLVDISFSQIESDEGRRYIALLVASAHQQLRQSKQARSFTRIALKWGVDKYFVAKVFIASVNNTLGRIAALQGNKEKLTSAFASSVDIGNDDDFELLGHQRAVHEMVDLGLLAEANTLISSLQTSSHIDSKKLSVLSLEVDWIREKVTQIQKVQAKDLYKQKISAASLGKVKKKEQTEKRYYGLNKLDQKLEVYLDYDNGFYVELGANDGLSQSNTAYFEKNRNWRGVLIEPVLHKLLECKANRSEYNYFECSACVSFGYQSDSVKLHYANLMTSPEVVGSDIESPKEHADFGRVYDQCDSSIEILAKASTLQKILDNAVAPKTIDLLSLDVEGAELEVLNGVDHDIYRFKYILIECRDLNKIQGCMSEWGYVLVNKLSNHDYLYKTLEIDK